MNTVDQTPRWLNDFVLLNGLNADTKDDACERASTENLVGERPVRAVLKAWNGDGAYEVPSF